VRTHGDEKPIPHKVSEINRRGKKFLQGETRTKAPRTIEHSCKWGIYHGQLDYFHGKYLDVHTVAQARQLGRAPGLPLDLVPQLADGTLRVEVVWQGKPHAKATVNVWSPGGREQKYVANGQGIVEIANAKPGLYSFSVRVTLPEEEGEFGGEAYQGVMHGTTLTLRWPLE
jgi:hypothetical protein